MSSGGGGTQTVTNKADPWAAAQPALQRAIGGAEDLYRRGEFSTTPYAAPRVAGFGGTTQQAQQMVRDRAGGGAPLLDQASGTLSDMMGGDYQSDLLNRVKDNALGSAVPAAVSMFSGSGMTNSSQAMDTVGRAATEAVAPIEYGAFENAQNRAMSAAGMAPQIEAAGYMPAQMLGGVGASEDALSQANIDADISKYFETENQEVNNFSNYLARLTALGGMGGSSSSTQPSNNPSFLTRAASGGLGGLGAYGALAANPATAGVAVPLGVAAGLMGMF